MSRPLCSKPRCQREVVGRRLCRTHYQRAWKAGAFINQPLPPREPGRTICPTGHKHGAASTCYILHQCRCPECRQAHAKMQQQRVKQKAYGRFDRGLVPAAPIRAHMMALAEYGIGYKRVAMLAGIGTTAARTLIWGRQDPGPRNGELQKQVKRETAEAILSVQPVLANLGSKVHVPALPFARRVQALVAAGWSVSQIARRCGVLDTNFSILRRVEAAGDDVDQVKISAMLARRISDVYETLSTQAPSAETHHQRLAVTRAKAAGHHWPLPMDWEASGKSFDATTPPKRSTASTDDVDEFIDELAIDHALAGHPIDLTRTERNIAINRLHERGDSDPEIATRFNLSISQVNHIRHKTTQKAEAA